MSRAEVVRGVPSCDRSTGCPKTFLMNSASISDPIKLAHVLRPVLPRLCCWLTSRCRRSWHLRESKFPTSTFLMNSVKASSGFALPSFSRQRDCRLATVHVQLEKLERRFDLKEYMIVSFRVIAPREEQMKVVEDVEPGLHCGRERQGGAGVE